MPCCQWVLSVAEQSSSNNTPAWLHRLHAKGGFSVPSDLQIGDLFHGKPKPQPPPPRPPTPPPPPPPPALLPPPPPPPPASSDRRLALITPLDPPPNPAPKPPRPPNPSATTTHPPPQPPPPPPPLSGVISDLFAVPSAQRTGRPAKPFRKQSRPRPRPKDKPASGKDDKDKAKARKRRRADRHAAVADGERRSRIEVTVIDSSTDGWKSAKLAVRQGTRWKALDRKTSGASEAEELSKGKRRAGLVAKVMRDKEKERDNAALLGNIHAGTGYLTMLPPGDDAIQPVKRPRSSEPAPGGQSAPILMLPSSSTVSQP